MEGPCEAVMEELADAKEQLATGRAFERHLGEEGCDTCPHTIRCSRAFP